MKNIIITTIIIIIEYYLQLNVIFIVSYYMNIIKIMFSTLTVSYIAGCLKLPLQSCSR